MIQHKEHLFTYFLGTTITNEINEFLMRKIIRHWKCIYCDETWDEIVWEF